LFHVSTVDVITFSCVTKLKTLFKLVQSSNFPEGRVTQEINVKACALLIPKKLVDTP